ncbi:acid-sensing ion channel 4-A-like [Rhopilema esculentum]|uniref:acid-sensing ion channel 4-A-like n=1 Tax=Rhopilema esculentum TaxID=499914 RepID=UPI0031CFF611|eukprot:gene11429-21631_t
MELKDSAANMSMHGFGRIFISKSKRIQFVWLVIMICNLVIFNICFISLLRYYLSNPSMTKSETVITSKIRFPSVTVCGPSVSKHKLERFAEESNKTIQVDFDVNKKFPHPFFRSEEILQNLSTVENYWRIIPDMESLFMTNTSGFCTFATLEKCNFTSDIGRVLVFYKGVCNKVNMNGKYFQKKPGSLHGLSFILFVNISDVVPWALSSEGDSVYVDIKEFDEPVFHGSGSILASVGQLTRIEISKTVVTRLKSPFHSNCTNGENKPLLFEGTYTIENCHITCALNMAHKQCKSIDFHNNMFLPEHMRKNSTNISEAVACSTSIYNYLIDTNFESCHCQLPCMETKFHKTVSTAKWPPKNDLPAYKALASAAFGLNKSEVTDEFIRNNFLKIDVYFGELSFQKITEVEEFTTVKLISDIGGQMGIWVGASVFSVVELLFLLWQSIKYFVNRNNITEEHPDN